MNLDTILAWSSLVRPCAFFTFLVVQSLSRVQLFATPQTVACQACLSITNFQSLLKLKSIESAMPSNHLIVCRPLLLRLQSFPASESSNSQLFTSGGQSIIASASVLPMKIQDWSPLGLTGLIPCSPRDSQESLQHHSSKPSILRCSLSHFQKDKEALSAS